MGIEALICPQCGHSVKPESKPWFQCPYCMSWLKLKKDTVGESYYALGEKIGQTIQEVKIEIKNTISSTALDTLKKIQERIDKQAELTRAVSELRDLGKEIALDLELIKQHPDIYKNKKQLQAHKDKEKQLSTLIRQLNTELDSEQKEKLNSGTRSPDAADMAPTEKKIIYNDRFSYFLGSMSIVGVVLFVSFLLLKAKWHLDVILCLFLIDIIISVFLTIWLSPNPDD